MGDFDGIEVDADVDADWSSVFNDDAVAESPLIAVCGQLSSTCTTSCKLVGYIEFI